MLMVSRASRAASHFESLQDLPKRPMGTYMCDKPMVDNIQCVKSSSRGSIAPRARGRRWHSVGRDGGKQRYVPLAGGPKIKAKDRGVLAGSAPQKHSATTNTRLNALPRLEMSNCTRDARLKLTGFSIGKPLRCGCWWQS